MTIGEMKTALDNYPDDAILVVGIQIPDLYINTIANGTITGNAVKADECTKVQFLASVPPRLPDIKLNNEALKPDASQSEETTDNSDNG